MSLAESEHVRELLARAGLAEMSPMARRGLLAGLALVIGAGLWRFWPAAPAPEVEFTEARDQAAVAGAEEEQTAVPEAVVVHVAGAVAHPGVYELPLGARVADALDAAGGALGSAASDAVNLARILSDGEQIYLPSEDEVAAGALEAAGVQPGSGAGSTGSSEVVNINTASAAELETLPGVGPSTAQKIVDDREANGPFARPEDLMRVPGIGPKKFEALQDFVECR